MNFTYSQYSPRENIIVIKRFTFTAVHLVLSNQKRSQIMEIPEVGVEKAFWNIGTPDNL